LKRSACCLYNGVSWDRKFSMGFF